MYMNYITTTELRTKTSELIAQLLAGKKEHLIHRSKLIGKIEPQREQARKVLTAKDIRELKNIVKSLNLPQTTIAEREKNYRKHLEDKYGKPIS